MKLDFLNVTYGDHATSIPYTILDGGRPGPHLFLSAGMHGGEINGIAVVDTFMRWCEQVNIVERLEGKITILPLLNPSGFARRQRRVAEDNGDLNRAFGVEATETFTEQVAATLTDQLLRHCDCGIDFHDASGSAALLPHARFHREEASGFTQEMAQLFGTKIIIARTGKPNMMAIAMNQQHKVPVLTVEVGGSQRLFPEYIALAMRGIRNFLSAYDMYPGDILTPQRQFLLNRRYGIKQKEAAMVTLDAQLGQHVHAGDVLGRLYFPQRNEEQSIKSPLCGIVFSLQQLNQVEEGDTLFSILETDACHVDRPTLSEFRELENLKVTKIKM